MSPSKLTARTPSKLSSEEGPSISRFQRSPLKRDESPVQTVFRQRSPSKREDSPLRSRSPLKSREDSPTRQQRTSLPKRSPKSQRSQPKEDAESPVRQRSPLKREETFTVRSPGKTTVTSYKSPIRSSQSSDKHERGQDFHKETYNREVTEKKTTIDHSPVKDSLSGVETFKKTVVTEKEETISKTEVLKFTEVGPGRVGEIDPLKLLEERRSRRRQVKPKCFSPSNYLFSTKILFSDLLLLCFVGCI